MVNWSRYSNLGLPLILQAGYRQVSLMLTFASVLVAMLDDCLVSGYYYFRWLQSYFPCDYVQYQFFERQHFLKPVY